ncbi:MAG: aldehyde dehydrogenase [Rhodospirillaceae bacterium]|nr:aldehyde dehydrogenase [Rhodospirillaceae bacterium]|tara:strand:+ start:4588 stop:6738 length:2151 start_codon:yes stop_codon:yes gene_type:complete
MPESASLKKSPELDQWISIGPDGKVLIRTGKVDIGQRISTALALVAAEELDIDIDRVVIARTATGIDPDEGITSGSNSMEEAGNAVRAASATARRHLLSLAADALAVDIATLEISDGLIHSRETNRSITYEELMADQSFRIEVDPDAPVKDPSSYSIIGQTIVARGLKEVVTGQPHFVQDMKMPSMRHARVVRPPHYQARLNSLDDSVVERIGENGGTIVCDGSFIAVTHTDEYSAVKAAERLFESSDWDTGDGLEPQDVFERLVANDRVSLPVVDGVPQKGEVMPLAPPLPEATSTVSARYEKPYLMHGSIGPSAAVALAEGKQLTIWTHSQGVYVLRASLAEALDVEMDDLKIIHVPGSGCYGHNGADDAAVDAALIALATPGTPILLKWTREDEHAWEPYGSCMSMDLTASLDIKGKVISWSQETYSDTYGMRPRPEPGGAGPARLLPMQYREGALAPLLPQPNMSRHAGLHRNLDPLYSFANKRLVKNLVRGLPLRTSALRTLGGFANVFAIESFMDELAEDAGIDSVQFRLDNLDDERAKDVIAAAADAIGWGDDVSDGRGRGIGFAQYKNIQAYAAVVVELEVNDLAEVKLHRVALAGDAGQIIDHAGLTAQYEGGFLQAASWTLYEAVTYDRTGITSRDWETYPILRFDNIPEIETVLIDRPKERFLGAGEAVSGPTAGAIANAIYNATSLRLRRLPFTPDAIRAAAME